MCSVLSLIYKNILISRFTTLHYCLTLNTDGPELKESFERKLNIHL